MLRKSYSSKKMTNLKCRTCIFQMLSFLSETLLIYNLLSIHLFYYQQCRFHKTSSYVLFSLRSKNEGELFASHQSLVTSYQSLVTSYQLLVTSHQSLVTSHQLLVASHQSLVTSCQSLVTSYQLLVTSHQSLATIHQLLATSRQLLITGYYYQPSLVASHQLLLVTGKQVLVDEIYEISKPFSIALNP